MKTIVPFKTSIAALLLLQLFAVPGAMAQTQAQTSPNLTFSNSSLYSGQAGTVGAVYRFPSVSNSLDAFVKISDRSSSLVKLVSIDLTNTGFNKAFQPQISYNNGSVSSSANWWMEFEVSFVNRNTTTPASITTFKATAIDIDGDNNRLKEWVSFYGHTSYMMESNSPLQVTSLTQTVLGLLQTVGTTFTGVINQYNGIDTAQTGLMTTVTFDNKNSFTFRIGASTTGAASVTERMYAVWFKDFAYNAPVVATLPVKLTSFTASLRQDQAKVDLKWTTASEINVSHFVIEKSYDGKNFSDAGVMFAYGSMSEKANYSFADNINGSGQPIIYYRLRSVDNDSKIQFSEIRIIRIGKQAESLALMTYPNPVAGELRVTVPSAWQGKSLLIELFNQGGQRIKALKTGSASQTETIMVSDLNKGFYIVKASCGIEIAQQKVIKN